MTVQEVVAVVGTGTAVAIAVLNVGRQITAGIREQAATAARLEDKVDHASEGIGGIIKRLDVLNGTVATIEKEGCTNHKVRTAQKAADGKGG